MSKWFITAGCVGLAALLAQAVPTVDAQGPIREGARRTGQAVAEGAQAAAEGTRRVIRGAGEVAAGTARGTAEAARRLTGRETRYDAQGRAYYVETEPQPYEAGYRGVEDQQSQEQFQQDAGPAQTVFLDRCGRQFICVDGRRVYVDPRSSEGQQFQGPYEAHRPLIGDDQRMRNGGRAPNEAAPPLPPDAANSEAQLEQRSDQELNENQSDASATGEQPSINADSSTNSSDANPTDGNSSNDDSSNEKSANENETP